MNNSLITLIDNLNTRDVEQAWSSSVDFFASYGFHITNFGIISKEHSNIVGFFSNMPDNWMQYYMDNGYDADDPYGHYVAQNHDDLIYSRDGHSELVIEDNTLGKQMMDEVAELGMINSLCIPIHNSFGDKISGFNLGTDLNCLEFNKMLEENKREILLAAALVNNVMVDVPMLDCPSSSWYVSPRLEKLLSVREIEVIKWLSEGHRNDRIAEKMSIAPVTVNFHLKEIKRKLGAKTREQAVALAYKKRLLG